MHQMWCGDHGAIAHGCAYAALVEEARAAVHE